MLRVGRPAVAGVGRDRLGDTGVEVGHAVDEGALGGDIVVTLGAREVEDEWRLFAFELFVDGGEGAEQETARVGHDGAAAGRDLVGGKEFV